MEKDFIKIYSTSEQFQADIAREILEESNVNSVVLNQHDSMIPSIGGDIEIYVHKNDQEAAREILKNLKH